VTVSLVFETHSITEDNEAGVATGWLPGRLSAQGRELAVALGERRRADDLAAVLSSDLRRAAETAWLAFPTGRPQVLLDWRLRECDYGELNGAPRPAVLDDRAAHLTVPYPDGESWTQAVQRVARVLPDVAARWPGRRVLIVGHVATWWALEHRLRGRPLDDLAAAPFRWQEGWEYVL
jgi:2,3-bisphosphoglycerate-dependent phosphoglycerate mutase